MSDAAAQPADAIKRAILDLLASSFDASVVAHDLQHLCRVARTAARINLSEGGDPVVVLAASLLHDLHRLQEKRLRRHVSPAEAEPLVLELLACVPAVPASRHRAILDAVNFTEAYRCAGDDLAALNPSVEARVVRDADMLDALGAVGIARAFMFGGYLGEPLWAPGAETAGHFTHGKTHSVVHHFHEKLLRLEHEMLTEPGRKLARERTRTMRRFLDELMAEIDPSVDDGRAPHPRAPAAQGASSQGT